MASKPFTNEEVEDFIMYTSSPTPHARTTNLRLWRKSSSSQNSPSHWELTLPCFPRQPGRLSGGSPSMVSGELALRRAMRPAASAPAQNHSGNCDIIGLRSDERRVGKECVSTCRYR